MGYEINERPLLGGGGAAFEELVAKRAIGAEPLARRSGEDAGPATVRAGLLGVYLGDRIGQLHQGQRLDLFRSGWRIDRLGDGHRHRFARRRLDRRYGWCL